MHPFRLEPLFKTRPWGVRSLAPWFDHVPGAEPVGEVWFTANENPVAGTDRTLGDLLAHDPAALVGRATRGSVFPLLLKFLFTSDRLSVQVHPDDEYADRHHQSLGKTEAWHVLQHADDSTVGIGFRARLTRDEAVAAARSGALDRLLDWKKTRTGDTWLVPAGTVHAIGPGLTIVEVQEHSDITYRLYDYGRPRELHLDHGFTVARLEPYEIRNDDVTLGAGRMLLTRCGYFTLERWRPDGRLTFAAGQPFYHLLIVTAGEGRLDSKPLLPGQVWVVPAAASTFHIDASQDLELLVAYTSADVSTAFS